MNKNIKNFIELFVDKYFYRRTKSSKEYIEFELYGVGKEYSIAQGTLIIRCYLNEEKVEIGSYDSKNEEIVNMIIDDIQSVYGDCNFQKNSLRNEKMYIINMTPKVPVIVKKTRQEHK